MGERMELSTNPAVVVRRYRESDEEAVLALWEAAGIGRPWLDLRAEIAEKLRRDRDLFLVAVEPSEHDAEGADERLVGAAMGAYDGRRGWIYHLATAPECQRRGIGRALVVELERAMRAIGVSKINLQVRADNVGVVGFYERLGYTDEHLVSMGKRLK
jgi:ribosomal protein S18 acetylase RimI-like enzyme